MSHIPNPSPPPSSPGCCIAEGVSLQIPAEFGIGPLRPVWASAAAGLVLLCTVLPGPLRIAIAAATWRAVMRLVPARHGHGGPVTLRRDEAGRWSLVDAPQCGALRLRRAARLPGLGWLLEFAGECGPLWLWLPARSLGRRSGRLLARLATAERT